MPKVKITLEKCHEIAEWWSPEKTFVETAKHFDIDVYSARRALKRAGVYVPRGAKPYTDDEQEKLKRLLLSGLTAEQIAHEIGRPVHGVRAVIARRHFTGRRPGRPAKVSMASSNYKAFGDSARWLSTSLRVQA